MARPVAQTGGGLSQAAVNSIASAVAQGVQVAQRGRRADAMNPLEERRKEYISGIQKEAALARALTTEAGLRKIDCGLAT